MVHMVGLSDPIYATKPHSRGIKKELPAADTLTFTILEGNTKNPDFCF